MELKIELSKDVLGDWGNWIGRSTGWYSDFREINITELLSTMAQEITRQAKKIAAFEAKFGPVEVE